MSKEELIKEIQDNREWLETTEGDMIECVGIENLEGILSKFIGEELKISEIGS